jgi:hypothetical protein
MSADEYAVFEKACGASVVNVGSQWWRQIRPYFYRPLPWFHELDPKKVTPPASSHLGGYQHLVAEGSAHNSNMKVLLFQSPQAYSLDKLSSNDRYHIRRAMKSFHLQPITDLARFIDQGHEVYLSFYHRTHYSYRNDRVEKKNFASWAETLLRFPKVQVCGAFSGDMLMSVSVAYVVEHVMFTATFFSRSEALSEYVSDLMLHCLRERAAQDDSIRLVYASMAGMERGLDQFYLRRGAQVVAKPAMLRLNPIIRAALKTFKKQEYQKLGYVESSS